MSLKAYFRLLFLGILVILSGCAADTISDKATESDLFLLGQQHLENEKYVPASEAFKELEARYPYSPYATQGQLEIIYCHFQNYENIEAVAAADRFIRLHPRHPNVDYAYYMRGVATYQESSNPFSRYLPGLSVESRDLGALKDAYEYFAQLTDRHPNSVYSVDARKRMVFIRNMVAERELNIAHYYENRSYRVAAINRSAWVLENLQQTPATNNALAVMARNYYGLGMTELADQTVDILRYNDPSHPSLDENGAFIDQEQDDVIVLSDAKSLDGAFERRYIERNVDNAEEISNKQDNALRELDEEAAERAEEAAEKDKELEE